MNVLALDLGGTKLAAAVIDSAGNILQRHSAPLGNKSGSDVGALIIDVVRQFSGASIKAVGVGVPGIYRAATGTVWAPNIPGWEDYPLLDELTTELGTAVPCAIESDRSCYILGEVWQGSAREARNAIFIAVGTGIGAGIMCDGRVIHGQHDIAGAVGWLALDRPYREEYRGCGNFEYFASGPGIARAAQAAGMLEATTASVFAAYDQNDERARAVIAQAVAYWGMGVANLVSIFNPEVIVFGGGVFGPARVLLEDIRREAAQWAQPISMKQVRLVSSVLGSDIGVLGAARVALDQHE